jgi:protein-disulfide isomerase
VRFPRIRVDPYFLAGLASVLVAGAVYAFAGVRDGGGPRDLPGGLTDRLEALGLGYATGSAAAPVHVVEITDYQCPACARAHAENGPALRRYVEDGTIRLTTYAVPLPRHANAVPAALVAECGRGEDAGASDRTRTALHATRDRWAEAYPAEPAILSALAGAGVDTTGVRGCLDADPGPRAAALRSGWEAVSTSGITYTPAVAVNGRIVPWPELEAAIRDALPRPRSNGAR